MILLNFKNGENRRNGFTLVELIAVLVLVGFLMAMGGTGLVATVQGYLLARENTAMSQKAQLALTRLTNEFRVCYDCIGNDEIIEDRPFIFTNVLGDRELDLEDAALTINGDPLLDQVGSFALSYDDQGMIVIVLGLDHQQADTSLAFTTRVLPRNSYQ